MERTFSIPMNRGTVLHFMRQALDELLRVDKNENARNYSNLLTRTVNKLAQSKLINEACTFQSLSQTDPLMILLAKAYQQLFALSYLIPLPGQAVQSFNQSFLLSLKQVSKGW